MDVDPPPRDRDHGDRDHDANGAPHPHPQHDDRAAPDANGKDYAPSNGGGSADDARADAAQRGEKIVKLNKVYIGGLPEHTRKEDLESCFRNIGTIVNIELKVGYGFVEFDSREAAEESVAKYHEGYFMGNKIRVEISHGGGRTAKYTGDPGACFKCGLMGHWARECPNMTSGAILEVMLLSLTASKPPETTLLPRGTIPTGEGSTPICLLAVTRATTTILLLVPTAVLQALPLLRLLALTLEAIILEESLCLRLATPLATILLLGTITTVTIGDLVPLLLLLRLVLLATIMTVLLATTLLRLAAVLLLPRLLVTTTTLLPVLGASSLDTGTFFSCSPPSPATRLTPSPPRSGRGRSQSPPPPRSSSGAPYDTAGYGSGGPPYNSSSGYANGGYSAGGAPPPRGSGGNRDYPPPRSRDAEPASSYRRA
ncbi:uncharacterized protein BXZ73DRAFT_102656 [Epithele typhae]|uniref:uncharacterized protein n=1 Tax=Epithele typhae TaxID=378194 RepID=UPI0020073C64|nr:uncharacterized protein BXZ73DRAFT_102656 [Epithele typhae]KAH9927526.1 hypothetical protein BXZ73DRAFT_102656 [Epithele typhae]